MRQESNKSPGDIRRASISRRKFLALATAGVSAAAWPLFGPRALASDLGVRRRVAIVGGGLAGLSTARHLQKLGVSDVVVLEARSRVGGRTLNLVSRTGHHLESGGEWTGPGQDRIQALASDLGVATFPCYYKGDAIFELGHSRHRGLMPELGAGDITDFLATAWRLHRLGQGVPVEHAWQAENADQLDRQTLADWLLANVQNRAVHGIFSRFTRAVFTAYPHHISLLWYLFYMRSCGGLWSLMRMEGGAQDSRFEGGSQEISLRMANALPGQVLLDQAVTEITDRPGEPVLIKTGSGTISCERVVVAMSPADAMRIEFSEGLTPDRSALMAHWANTPRLPAMKVAVVYEGPFWRDAGLSGHVMGDRAPMQLTFDNSPRGGEVGIISLFLSLIEAPELTDGEVRKQAIIDGLVERFGPRAAKPIDYAEKDWALDPWSAGCVLPLGTEVLSRFGHCLRQPVGRIHWSGTETSPIWCGYMDGAVRSGERCAVEVHDALRLDDASRG